MNTFGNFGGFLGPMVVGYAVERWSSWTIPFQITATVYAAGALLWLAVDPNRKLVPEGLTTSSRPSGCS